jgi:NADPH2:quinone reductase
VLDPVGIAQDVALRCVNHGGKLLIAGFAGGSIPAYAANRILLRGGAVIGIRAGEAGRRNPQMRRHELEALYVLAAQGLVRPLVLATYPLHRYAEAMHVLASRQGIGRIALTNGD